MTETKDGIGSQVTWKGCGHAACACCLQCFDEQAAELRSVVGLFNTQAAVLCAPVIQRVEQRWRKAHPDQDIRSPQIHRLVEWLLDETDRLEGR